MKDNVEEEDIIDLRDKIDITSDELNGNIICDELAIAYNREIIVNVKVYSPQKPIVNSNITRGDKWNGYTRINSVCILSINKKYKENRIQVY